MKLLNTLLLLCATLAQSYAIDCYAGADAAAATAAGSTTCDAGNNCQSPKWTAYGGYTGDGTFKCAASACGANDDCVLCATYKAGCNKPKDSTDFKCYKWTYANSAWKKADKSTVCKITTDDKKMCNAPNREKAEEDTTSANGCGPCATDKYNAETCQECYGAECNGSAFLSVSVLLVALSAIVYLV